MKRFLPFFLIFLFGCLSVQKTKTDFEIFSLTSDLLHLNGNAIFNYQEFKHINGSELSCRAISSVDIITINGDRALAVKMRNDVTPFSLEHFKRFLPFFREKARMPNSVTVYKNISILKLDEGDSIGFFEKNNTLYIGRSSLLFQIIDNSKTNLPFNEVINSVNGNFVYFSNKYPKYVGYDTQTAAWAEIIESNITRITVKIILKPINGNEMQINQYIDEKKLIKQYETFFNNKPGLKVKSIKAIRIGKNIEINIEIIGDFNLFMKNIIDI